MPAYDYDCAACGHRFEVAHGVHADSPTACPSCGRGPVTKAISAPAIHYKGSGWAKKERRATASPGSSKSTSEGTSSGDGSPKDGSPKTDSSSSDAPTTPPAKAAAAGGATASD